MKKSPHIKFSKNERGIALIVVVGMLGVITIIITSMMTQSRVANISSRVNGGRLLLRYDAESALSRSLWNYLWDRKKYPSAHNNLGTTQEREEGEEPWLADGFPRYPKFSDTEKSNASCAIHDAANGINLEPYRPGRQLRTDQKITSIEDEEVRERKLTFTYALDDYVDPDDSGYSEYTWEIDKYAEYGLSDFPCNDNLQLREEVYWIPEVQEFLSGNLGASYKNPFRILPPRRWRKGPYRRYGFVEKLSNKKSNLFSSDSNRISDEYELTEDQTEQLNKLKNREIDWEEVDDETRGILNRFSRSESGFATLEATAELYDGEVKRTIITTVNCNNEFKGNKKYYHVWEKVTY